MFPCPSFQKHWDILILNQHPCTLTSMSSNCASGRLKSPPYVPDRLPINASRLHGDVPDVEAPEPLNKVSCRISEAAKMLLGPCAFAQAEYKPRSMTCEHLNRNISHKALPSLPPMPCRKDAECQSLPRVLFRKEGDSPLFLNVSRVKLISGFETPMQVTTSRAHDHNSLTPFSSVVETEGHEQLIPFIVTMLRSPSFILRPSTVVSCISRVGRNVFCVHKKGMDARTRPRNWG